MPTTTPESEVTLPTAVGIATSQPGATFGPRNMPDWEFVWLIEGSGQYRRDHTTAAAPEGSVVLCRPGAWDFFQWDTQRRSRHAYVHFHVRSLSPDWPAMQNWPLVRPPEQCQLLHALFRQILGWKPDGDAVLCRLMLLTMLRAFVTGQAGGDVPRSEYPSAVANTLAMIRRTLDGDPAAELPLRDLASAASVTPEHLCRLFKSSVAVSPGEAVRLARLDRSAALLARSNYTITQIAQMCGFASPFHFSRRFKEAFGYSPRDLRQHMSHGAPPPPLLLKA